MSSVTTLVIPNIELTLDQLITAIRRLEPEARAEVVKALLETELDVRLTELISRLSTRKPKEEFSDTDIASEVNAVRKHRAQ